MSKRPPRTAQLESWATEYRLIKGRMPTITYIYHTDYDRRESKIFSYWLDGEQPKNRFDLWKFQTNLEPKDLDTMTEGRREVFFKRMWDIYKYMKAS